MMSLSEFREWITTDPGAFRILRAAVDYVKQVDIGLPEELIQERAIRRLHTMYFPDPQPEERNRQR
jgi:hypothetical protein